MMTAGTGGFSGSAAETGPNAGFDPVLGKFRSKVNKKRKKKVQEEKDHEVSMAHSQLDKSLENIKKLKKNLGKKEKNIPAWVQAKITDTEHNTDAASSYTKESRENPNFPSRLFQYKVRIPEVGETIIYASSLGELQQKMRLLINPKYRADINIERILPAKAAEFFQTKRMNHMRNIKENQDQKNAQAMADQKIAAEKKRIGIKKQELQKQLQLKTQQLKKAAAQGSAPDETR